MENSATALAQNTPGPWLVEPTEDFNAAYRVMDEGECTVALCYQQPFDTWTAEANARLIAAAPDLWQASQRFYDAVQDYLDVPDSELPEELVAAMDALEAVWHTADGTLPEDQHGQVA